MIDAVTLDRIVNEHLDGHGPTRIALRLNLDGVPAPGGSTIWYRQSVHRLLKSKHGRDAMERARERRLLIARPRT